MKVAYLTGRYPSISHTFVLREVQELRARGVDVLPISVWRSEPGVLLARADRAEAGRTYSLLPAIGGDWLRAHVGAVRRGPRRYWSVFMRALGLSQPSPRGMAMAALWFAEAIVFWDRCRRAGAEHTHVHLNGTAPSVALLATGFARDIGVGPRTWSLTVHGPSEFYDVARERLGKKVRDADFVICISDFARSQLMGLVEESYWPKLEVVHCGVDPGAFRPTGKTSVSDGRPVRILSVGRLSPVKGQAVLLEAIAVLRDQGMDVNATLVGDGPRRGALERMCLDRGLTDRVALVGSVGQDEIRNLYAEADIFCMSSFAEGVPVVLMEAMAMAIPVIAPAITGIPELVEHGEQGLLVRPARPDLLAAAIRRLIENPEERAALGRAARQKVIDQFAIGDSADLLAGLFASRRTPG